MSEKFSDKRGDNDPKLCIRGTTDRKSDGNRPKEIRITQGLSSE